jgi:endoglucanase
MPLQRESLLLSILSQPSAPFRERHVIQTICRELDGGNVPYFIDPVGNIVIGVTSAREYRTLLARKPGAASRGEPLRVFIAHMDHPGFHGVKWKSNRELEVQWHGGSPTQHLEGAAVWLATSKGAVGQGEMTEAQLAPTGRGISTAVIKVPEGFKKHYPKETELYGGFSFRSPVWKEGELLFTKAADDLVGAFAITAMALDTWGKARPKKKKIQKARSSTPPFIGLLTRAEEVGFIGAIGHFELGWLPKAKREILCVSLETSRALPQAEIGKGPVVRLGDRTTVFDAGSLRVFTALAQKTLPEKHQRRIMDGGSCEATAASAYGLSSIGISVPLGNYHNQSFEGGPDSRGALGPAPEFVHLEDVAGLLTLCHALIEPGQAWSDPWKNEMTRFKKEYRGYRQLLKSGP